jgi:hypothetical protein
MECVEAFREASAAGDRCGRMAELKPGCTCEAQCVSPHSPGPVLGSEVLARLIYSPLHIDPATGEVNEAAFSDAKDKGLSVQREAHAAPAAIRAIGEMKLTADLTKGKTDRAFLGVVVAGAQVIRTITYQDGTRAFCVYDSALPGLQAHADVCQTSGGPSAMKRARKQLRDLFGRKPFMP